MIHANIHLRKLYVIIMSSASFKVNIHSLVCLNVKKILAQSRHHIWSLSDSNEIRTRNHLTITVNIWSFSIVFKGRLSFEVNFISLKSCPCSIGLPPFIVLIWYLIPFQSFACFFNTSLFLYVKAKVKYLLPFFFWCIHLLYQ